MSELRTDFAMPKIEDNTNNSSLEDQVHSILGNANLRSGARQNSFAAPEIAEPRHESLPDFRIDFKESASESRIPDESPVSKEQSFSLAYPTANPLTRNYSGAGGASTADLLAPYHESVTSRLPWYPYWKSFEQYMARNQKDMEDNYYSAGETFIPKKMPWEHSTGGK